MRVDNRIPTVTDQSTVLSRSGLILAAIACVLLAPIQLASQENASQDGAGEDPASASADNAAQQDAGLDELDLEWFLNPDVESASLLTERVSEAPATVTVITSEMIEAVGARNLKEVLTTYVPGMTDVESTDEINVALRGIYTSSQQKILFLLNGHRLNSRVYSSSAPDFSIGVHPSKIKQIEVVRGPGSAVYGNLALNGIVNIVTKTPEELDSAHVSAGTGTFGQQKLDLTTGKRFSEDHALLLWGSFFRSEGHSGVVPPEERFNKVTDAPPEAHLMGFKDPASFDVGGEYSFGDFTVMASRRQGKYVPPFSSGGLGGGQTYVYDDYRSWNGSKPGMTSSYTHADISYETPLNDHINFESSLYLDTNRTQKQTIIQPLVIDDRENRRGQTQEIVGWRERAVGNITQLSLDYEYGALGSGAVAVGTQFDAATLLDSEWLFGTRGEIQLVKDDIEEQAMPQGTETMYSAFTQLKHKFGYSEDVIANLGLRYDYKDRLRGDNIDALSPRTALIFGPDADLGLKVSYSRSFVDAPYWYRYNIAPNFRGEPDLQPEYMSAFQISPTVRLLDGRLRSTTNLYQATHSDIIFKKRTLDPSKALYQNSGELDIAGIEEEIAFLEDDYRLFGNITFQQPLYAENYSATGPGEPDTPFLGSEIHNVPKFFWNAVADVKPLWFSDADVWMSLAASYYAEQLSPIRVRYVGSDGRTGSLLGEDLHPNRTVSDRLLLRSSLRWKNIADSDFNLQATMHNILNTTYHQGGTTAHPYRQPGRWFMLQLSYDMGL